MTDNLLKTIQFFLPEGEPWGIRIAEITTRIVQAVAEKRRRESAWSGLPESTQAVIMATAKARAGDVEQRGRATVKRAL